MTRSPQARAKSWGYDLEVLSLRALTRIWPRLERTGASNQKTKAAPDLEEPGAPSDAIVLPLVLTKDKGRTHPLLVTLSSTDLIALLTMGPQSFTPVVQVKGRSSTWVGRLYEELQEASDAGRRAP